MGGQALVMQLHVLHRLFERACHIGERMKPDRARASTE